MSHVYHIQKNKEQLQIRFEIIRLMREFFWSQGFLEVETPHILRLPGQEPYLSPMKLTVHDEQGTEYPAFLHTSPEYTMKKMLAAGFYKIFSLGKVFRDHESFGGTHNPEFTMIEWYRANEDFYKIMEDVEELFYYLRNRLQTSDFRLQIIAEDRRPKTEVSFFRVHMRDLWREHVGVNLDEYLDAQSMRRLCTNKYQLTINNSETYEDLFYRVFLNAIEPKLTEPTIVHHYPASMAALAKLSEKDTEYAERFEVYVGGMELANCFTELTDADEQLRRLEADRNQRRALGKDVFDIDMDFIAALRPPRPPSREAGPMSGLVEAGHMPPSAGIALGVDRLVQVFLGCQNIDDVIPLPMSKLYG